MCGCCFWRQDASADRTRRGSSEEPGQICQDDASYEEADEPFAEWQLSYGERLVLDTFLRSRSRPYDRSRQEELARPRKRLGEASAEPDPLIARYAAKPAAERCRIVESAVSRLSTPRRRDASAPRNEGERIVAQQDSKRKQMYIRDMDDIVRRLNCPEKSSKNHEPPPGERIVLLHKARMASRSVNMQRIAEMALPSKHASSCKSRTASPRG